MNFDDVKKNAEETLNKTVEGAKDLAEKVADNEVVKNVKTGAEDVLNKAVDGAKDLADKANDLFKK